MGNSLKQQEQSEGEQNASETAGIYNENFSTTQTNQSGSTFAQVADQTASSQSRDVDISLLQNRVTSGTEATGQASCSSQPAHDSSCNEVNPPERGLKKYKVRYELFYSLLYVRPSVIFRVPCLLKVQLTPKVFLPLMNSTSFSNYISKKIISIDKIPACCPCGIDSTLDNLRSLKR